MLYTDWALRSVKIIVVSALEVSIDAHPVAGLVNFTGPVVDHRFFPHPLIHRTEKDN